MTLIKTNQEIINYGIKAIRSELNKFIFEFNDYMTVRNILDQLNLTLNIILQLLSDMENAIAFTKLGTVHSSILKIEELESILEKVVKYYSPNQLLFPHDTDTHRYYNLLEVEAYYSDTKIVFAVHFPIIHPDDFVYYHLYSIPTQNLTTIIPKNTYLTMNENFYQYMPVPCINLHPNFYCPTNEINNGLEDEDCIFHLLQITSIQGTCQSIPIQIVKDVIQQIDEGHYIAVFPNQTKIRTVCAERSDFRTLSGNHLINLPLGCQFQTNDRIFINNKVITGGQPMLLPEVKLPHSSHTINLPKITIKDVPLDKIHELQKEQNEIGKIVLNHQKKSFNYWAIPIYIIIILIGLYYGYKFIHGRVRSKSSRSGEEQPEETPRAFFTP